MGVVFKSNGVRKAKRLDGKMDAIALDSAAPDDVLRVMTCGRISYQDVRYSIKKVAGSPESSSIVAGTKLSISSSLDGVFEVSDASPVAVKGEGNTVIIQNL